MNLMTDERVLYSSDNKVITLSTHRIRYEKKIWGSVKLTSLMLEHVTSCEYKKESKPAYLIWGLLLVGLAIIIKSQGIVLPPTAQSSGAVEYDVIIYSGLLLVSIILIVMYFFTIRQGLIICSASARIFVNMSGVDYEKNLLFIDTLEAAINDRL